MKLTDKALLASLNISTWSARKFDKRTTQDVANTHGVSADVGRYNKSLLPHADKLRNVTNKAQAIRMQFYQNTLPWGMDGSRILPSRNYMAFMTAFRDERSEFETLVREFCNEYPNLKAAAKAYLGPLYEEADYPAVQDIERRFRMDMSVFPIPSNDFRVDIASDELARIQQDVEARVNQAAHNAMQDAWQRLYDKLDHLAGKLKDPESRLHKSALDNLWELCGVLTRLNFADDPDLEAMRQEVEQKILGEDINALRNNPEVREDTSKELDNIMSRMGTFMGGA